MSNKVLIASDSTTDLNAELLSRYQIKLLPLGVNLGDKLYLDGVDIYPDAIYEHYRNTGELPKTSAVNVGDHMDFFRKYTELGYDIVYFTISAEMSSTHANALLAAEDFPNVHIVDTRNLSTGGGLLASYAGDLAAQGISAAEIAMRCRALSSHVNASFVIDDLEFLHKGGRCSALEAFGANLLSLKPCIVVKNGKMGVGKKYRGKFGAVLEKYVAERIGDGSRIDCRRIFVTHAGCDPEIVEACVEQVRAMQLFDEIHVTRAGCTVSSHCGANTLGVLFIEKEPIC